MCFDLSKSTGAEGAPASLRAAGAKLKEGWPEGFDFREADAGRGYLALAAGSIRMSDAEFESRSGPKGERTRWTSLSPHITASGCSIKRVGWGGFVAAPRRCVARVMGPTALGRYRFRSNRGAWQRAVGST